MLTVQSKTSSIPSTVTILKKGGLIVAPTDTVYGLLVDATNEEAVKKLIAFKNRPWGKPISIFVNNELLKKNVIASESAGTLLKELLPGPFTIILPSKYAVSHLLESERGTLGIRIPQYRFINELVEAFGKPITATSANLSGRPPHYRPETLLSELPKAKKTLIDLFIDGGTLPRNKPSSIVDLTGDTIKLLRKGDIMFTSAKTYISHAPLDTRKLAQHLCSKISHVVDGQPLVFILEGELGTGKTEFVKGAGEYFGIRDIISPTYVVYYEYKWGKNANNRFIHADLYNIQEADEFKHLGLEEYLKPHCVIFIEWGNRAGDMIHTFKKSARIVRVKLKHKTEHEREISVEQ